LRYVHRFNTPRWGLKEEGKTMVDLLKGRELLRLSVLWPLRIKTDTGEVDGETRNITREGMFLYCPERLCEGIVYPMTIKIPGKRVEMTGKVAWSNLDNCTSLNLDSAMGFYFVRIDDEKDKEILGEAILAECRKLPHLKDEVDRRTDSFISGEVEATAHIDEIAENTPHSRN
jgi:PilZ domain